MGFYKVGQVPIEKILCPCGGEIDPEKKVCTKCGKNFDQEKKEENTNGS